MLTSHGKLNLYFPEGAPVDDVVRRILEALSKAVGRSVKVVSEKPAGESVKELIAQAIDRLKSYGKGGATIDEISVEAGCARSRVDLEVYAIAKEKGFRIYQVEKKLWEE